MLMLIMGGLQSCTAMFGSAGTGVAATSYLSEDSDMLGAEAAYADMEADLQYELDNYESLHPGYDEYRFDLDEIGHDPYVLTSILSALHEGVYTLGDVQGDLAMLFEKQYTLTQTIETETRYRTETRTDSEGNTYTVQVPYTYYICTQQRPKPFRIKAQLYTVPVKLRSCRRLDGIEAGVCAPARFIPRKTAFSLRYSAAILLRLSPKTEAHGTPFQGGRAQPNTIPDRSQEQSCWAVFLFGGDAYSVSAFQNHHRQA